MLPEVAPLKVRTVPLVPVKHSPVAQSPTLVTSPDPAPPASQLKFPKPSLVRNVFVPPTPCALGHE